MKTLKYWWKFLLSEPLALVAILVIATPALAIEIPEEEQIDYSTTVSSKASIFKSNFSDKTSKTSTFSVDYDLDSFSEISPKEKVKKDGEQIFNETTHLKQINSVNQLSDVRPTDWAFQALRSLVERYGVIQGYPDGTFRGRRAMTRYEFAAGLSAALERVSQLAGSGQVSQDDLITLQRLQQEFSKELETLRGRLDNLETRTTILEALQFSTTTKLQGQVIFAINGGGQTGDDGQDANTIFFSRVRLNLNTSFSGKDLLLTQLQASTSTAVNRLSSSGNLGFDAADILADASSRLFYSAGSFGFANAFELSRLSYSFPVTDDLNVTIFPRGFATDYIDDNKYASRQFDRADNFSTESLVSNILFFALDQPAAGAAAFWNPGQGDFTFRAVYAAQDFSVPDPNGAAATSVTSLVYGNPNGDNRGGLFGDPYIGFLELEYSPSEDLAVRLQYAGGAQGGTRFNILGANFDYTFSDNFGVFGRFGYAADFLPIPFPGIEPVYWEAGLAFPNLIHEGDLAGIAIAQPLIFQSSDPDVTGTQTNIEAFYNFKVSDNIRVTPLVQVIRHPLNNADSGTIFTGSLRTVFSF